MVVETPDQVVVEIPDSDRSLKVPPKNEGRGDSSVRTRKDSANIRSAAELCFILRSQLQPRKTLDQELPLKSAQLRVRKAACPRCVPSRIAPDYTNLRRGLFPTGNANARD